MIYKLRPSVRALAVVTAVAVAGLAPSLTESAHADGPVEAHAQRKAPSKHHKAPRKHRPHKKHHKAKPAMKPAKVIFNGGGPTAPLKPGALYNWPYSVTNQGPVRAAGVTLQTPLAAGLEFVSAQGNCSFQGNAPVCQIGDLAVGQTMTGLITAKVSVTAVAGQAVLNTAQVNWAGKQSSGVFPRTSVAVTADLAVTKSGPAEVQPGETASYDITVRNQGPATASKVVLNDNVAPVRAGQAVPVTLLDSPAGCTADTQTAGAPGLVCAMGDLAVGAMKTVTVKLKVGPQAKPGSVLQTPAKAATTTLELDLANNNAAGRTKITAPVRAAAQHLDQHLDQLPDTGADNRIFINAALAMLGLGLIFLRLGRSRSRRRG
jgi:uncharacterized repeat protein (TIGR01451 family)